MILPILSCMSAVKILCLSWHTSKFMHLLVVGGASYFNLILIFLKLDNKLLCYSFAHFNLFSARSRLYTSLLVIHS